MMFYFKFKSLGSCDDELYGKVNADKDKIDISKLEEFLQAVPNSLIEVTEEEYEQDENDLLR